MPMSELQQNDLHIFPGIGGLMYDGKSLFKSDEKGPF